MSQLLSNACICGSAKPHQRCCAVFLCGKSYPKTPEKLMRSRFSAFALGGHGQYLLDTWLPSMTQHLSAQELSQKNTQWVDLNIIAKSQSGDDGVVEFKAYFIDDEGNRQLHHERSVFKRVANRWLYVGGEVS